MNIYFLRHAQSMGNLTGDYSTILHDELSDLGKKQSLQLVSRLELYQFDFIFVSPSIRTMQTILPYLKKHNKTGILCGMMSESCWQEHREIDFNNVGSVNKGEKIQISNQMEKYFFLSDIKECRYFPADDESYEGGLARSYFVKSKLIESKNMNNTSILIVSHAYFMSRLIELLIQLEPIGRFDFDNASLSCVHFQNKRGQLKFLNLV